MNRNPIDMLSKILAVAFCVALLAGCASWEQLTKDQQARVVLDIAQEQLTNLRQGGKDWVLSLPEDTQEEKQYKLEKAQQWNTTVLPAIQIANDWIGDLMHELSRSEGVTLDRYAVQRLVYPYINKVIFLLVDMGYIPN